MDELFMLSHFVSNGSCTVIVRFDKVAVTHRTGLIGHGELLPFGFRNPRGVQLESDQRCN